nr:hypothetical protein [Vampirovibrio sp.]
IKEINDKYQASLTQPASAPEVMKTVVARSIEDGLVRHGQEFGNKTLGVAVAKKMAGSQLESFNRYLGTRGSTKEGLRVIYNNLNKYLGQANKLATKEPYTKGSLGKGLVKDVIKTAMKTYFQEQENQVWEEFFMAEAAQKSLYKAYQMSADAYWKSYDELIKVRKKHAELVFGYDSHSGFKILTREPFEDDQPVTIRLSLVKPEGFRESVSLNNVSAGTQTMPYEFNVDGSQLPKRAEQDISPLDLRIVHE